MREAATAAAAIAGITPLEYLLSIMRNTKLGVADRREAAKAAAPYVHPRLATVEVRAQPPSAPPIDISKISDEDAERTYLEMIHGSGAH
jgi:hypothetical protein